MKAYNQRFSITTILLALTLFAGIQSAHGQQKTRHEAAHVFQQAAATTAQDTDSDDDGLLRIEGSVHTSADASTRASSVKPIRMTLALHVSSAGDDPVVRKRPGRTKYSNVTLEKHTADSSQTKAQDYNSSRSNNSSAIHKPHPGTGATRRRATAPATDHNTTRSNRARSHVSDGALEHTDDWIAARVAASGGLHVVLIPLEEQDSNLHIPTDVHSGKLTGVRMHSPAKTAKPVDAATPYIYKTSVDENGAFVFEGVAPGSYQIRVLADGHEFRGHVTVLK